MLRKAYWRCKVFCIPKENKALGMAQRLSEQIPRYKNIQTTYQNGLKK